MKLVLVKYSRFWSLLALFCWGSSCFQTVVAAELNVDSLLQVARTTDSVEVKTNAYLQLSRHYRRSNLDTSTIYIDLALEAATEGEDPQLFTRVKMSQAAIFWTQGQLDEASHIYEDALVFWEKEGVQWEVARCLLNLGNVKYSSREQDKALEYLNRARIEAKATGDKVLQAQTLGTIGNVYYGQEVWDSCIAYTEQAGQLFLELNDSANLVRVHTNLGVFYREIGKSYHARPHYRQALGYLAGTDEKGLKGEAYEGLGQLEYRVGNFDAAIENFLLARENFSQLGWYRKIAGNQIMVGECFKLLDRQETAREVWEEAYYLADSVNDHDLVASAITNLGNLDREEGHYEKAIVRYREAIDRGVDETQKFNRYMGLGLSFKHTDQPDSAEKYVGLALALGRRLNNELELGFAFYDLAEYALEENQDAQGCNFYLDSAFFYFSINNHPRGLRDSYWLESRSLEQMGDFVGALKAERSAGQWQDSMSIANVDESLLALEAERWSEKQEHALQMAQKNEELQTAEAARLQARSEKITTQRNLLISILILLLIAGISLYYLNIKRKQNKMKHKISELRLRALRSQMNPHFIFNALGSMQLLINTGQSMEANLYLSKFARLLRMILENSANDRLSLEEEIESLKLYVELEALRFKFQYQITVDEALDLADIQMPGMVIQPFVENAIKHGISGKSEEGKLQLGFQKVGGELLCTIEDNGIGRKAAGKIKKETKGHTSRGIQIIEEQLSLIRPTRPDRLTFTDLQNEAGAPLGTRVEIRLPLHPINE